MKKWKVIILAVLIISQITVISVPAFAENVGYRVTENKQGTQDGYSYELKKDFGNTEMVLDGNGCFTCKWSNIVNAFFKMGMSFDSTKVYQEIGNITLDYGARYNPSGNSYLCVYGWTKSPLVEFYIIESWGSWRPPGASSKGTITVDGGMYDVYVTTKVNQPSIEGNTTYKQYWSVRTSKKTEGKVSVSEHFKAWESMGLILGKLYDISLCVEGLLSSGTAEIYKNDFKINDKSVFSPETASFLSEGNLWIVGGVIAVGAVGVTGTVFAVKKKKAAKPKAR